MTELRNSALRATWWSALEVAARYAVQFFVTILLARMLPPTAFGLIAMMLVFTSIGTLFVDAGFASALVQRQSISEDDRTTVFLFSLSSATLIAATLWAAAPLIAAFYDHPELLALTRAMCLSLPISALAAVPDAVITQRLDFKSRTHAQLVAAVVSAAVATICAFRGLGVWSMVIQTLVAAGIRSGLLWWYSRWWPRGRFRRRSFLDLFSFGGFYFLTALLDTAATRLQSLMIGKLFDARTLGYYTLAQNTQQPPASFIGIILGKVGLPVFSKLVADGGELRPAIRTSVRMSLFLFMPWMALLAVVAKPLVLALYGPRWAPSAPIVFWLALSAALWPLHSLNLTALNALGRSDLYFRIEVGKKSLLIAGLLLFSRYGPVAVAMTVFVNSLLGILLNTAYAKRLLDYGMLEQLADQRETMFLSLLAGTAAWIVVQWVATPMLAVAVATITAAVIYLLAALALRPAALADLIRMFIAWRGGLARQEHIGR